MKKLVIVIISLLVILSGCSGDNETVNIINPVEDLESFNTFLDEEFIETMEDDLMNMHYTIYDYKAYGIEKPEAFLGDISQEEYNEIIESNNEVIKKLKEFDYNTLSSSQKIDYRVLSWALNNSNEINKYPLLDFYFRPSSGIQNNIITNFMEYAFYDEESVIDYLALLSDVDRLFLDTIKFSEEQIVANIFLSDYTIDETIDGIDNLLSAKENNQFIVSFNNKIDNLAIDDALKENYKQQNRTLVLDEVLPAYENVKAFLKENRNVSKYNDQGLCSLPNGKDYYAKLFANKTSSNVSVDEAFNNLNEYLVDQLIELAKVMQEDETLFDDMLNYQYENDTVGILNDLENSYSQLVPMMDEFIYELSYLDPTITDPNVSAYYVSGPLDKVDADVIRVNGENNSDSLSLYITLAHEGLPGHMYQFNYYKKTNPRNIRNVLSFIGYTEGWAMYQELLALDLLPFEKPALAKLFKFDTCFSYVLQTAVDIGVNYYGWNEEETLQYMSEYGYDDINLARNIRQAVICEPLQIVPYGYGLYFYDSMYQKAINKLNDEFDLHEFNKILLDNGPRPLDMVYEDVLSYLD